jgi:hypothetical protein
MAVKYGIISPQTGQYNYVEREDELFAKMASAAMTFYLTHTHNSPISRIEVNEDGSETWSALDIDAHFPQLENAKWVEKYTKPAPR